MYDTTDSYYAAHCTWTQSQAHSNVHWEDTLKPTSIQRSNPNPAVVDPSEIFFSTLLWWWRGTIRIFWRSQDSDSIKHFHISFLAQLSFYNNKKMIKIWFSFRAQIISPKLRNSYHLNQQIYTTAKHQWIESDIHNWYGIPVRILENQKKIIIIS